MWSRHMSVTLKNSSPAGVSTGRGYMEICAGFKSNLSRPSQDTVVPTPQVVFLILMYRSASICRYQRPKTRGSGSLLVL